ncbi:MAG: polysaccharide deacetylase family protein [Christensenellales bacterium]|jgi:peptidoglycan/xylan/chitin deacetylase (PgdA/CDA1 family)
MNSSTAKRFIAVCVCFAVFAGVWGTSPYAAGAEGEVRLPVIMYHKILSRKESGSALLAEQLEQDLAALKRAGYTCVFPSQVIAYVKGDGELPEKPVMLTFDDGYYSTACYALTLLQKYDMKGVVNIIGAFTEFSTTSKDHSNPYYSHLTWEQIKELADSGYFEIGNHTYNMHHYKPRFGIMPKEGEGERAYKQNLKSDIARLQKLLGEKCGVNPSIFAYPFGEYSDCAKQVLLEMGFEMLFTCNEGVCVIAKGDEKCLHYVKRFNRKASYSSDYLISLIEGA